MMLITVHRHWHFVSNIRSHPSETTKSLHHTILQPFLCIFFQQIFFFNLKGNFMNKCHTQLIYLKNLFCKSQSLNMSALWSALFRAIYLLLLAVHNKNCHQSVYHWRNFSLFFQIHKFSNNQVEVHSVLQSLLKAPWQLQQLFQLLMSHRADLQFEFDVFLFNSQ